MKKLFYIVGIIAVASLMSCKKDDDENTWETYREWREANRTWFAQQETKLDKDGRLFYEKVAPVWSPDEYILMHWFNDRSETAGNLVPLLTSTVSTCYIGHLYNDVPVDSSYKQVDALFNARVSGLVEGWQIALMSMHVGDTVQIVIPYSLGYGSSATGSIPPYSALRFNISLKDIPAYEVRP